MLSNFASTLKRALTEAQRMEMRALEAPARVGVGSSRHAHCNEQSGANALFAQEHVHAQKLFEQCCRS
jgi:hypothetical protein